MLLPWDCQGLVSSGGTLTNHEALPSARHQLGKCLLVSGCRASLDTHFVQNHSPPHTQISNSPTAVRARVPLTKGSFLEENSWGCSSDPVQLLKALL